MVVFISYNLQPLNLKNAAKYIVRNDVNHKLQALTSLMHIQTMNAYFKKNLLALKTF